MAGKMAIGGYCKADQETWEGEIWDDFMLKDVDTAMGG
jgi:hypothetical protein